MTDLRAPVELVTQWKSEIGREVPRSDVLENLRKQFKKMEKNKQMPDIPARVK